MTSTTERTRQDATRRRRYSPDPAKARWYAQHRSTRWRRHYFGQG